MPQLESPPGNEQRPGGAEALSDCWAAVSHKDTESTRCERCGRPLTARRSLERGRGPVCCRVAA